MKPHRVDVLSLVFGLIFVAMAAVGLSDRLTVTWSDLRWVVPAGLVAIGLALLITSARRQADRAIDEDRTGNGGTQAAG